MTQVTQIDATPETAPQERPVNWEYDTASECIRKAIECMKQNGGRDISLKVQFETWLNAEFWIPNEDAPKVPDELPWEK